ncbi:MAG: hypothetical protein KF873_13110 [Gemmataceae bacterium]|nr:hypothetical protein [Planctomycetia bacterium]MBX3399675.1 hypothetical protein [Gemmataceae bacterium]
MRTLLLLLAAPGFLSANEKPIAYPVPSEFLSQNGLYSLALIPPKSDDPLRKETGHHAGLRAKYAASGLYRSDDATKPLWTVDWFDYEVHVSDDGVHAVRIHGENDQWRHYKTDKRLPDETVREQLAAPAISFYVKGELLRTYTVREIVGRPEALPHTMRYILWNAGGVFTQDGKQFVQMTQDERQVIFDLDSGRIVVNREAGSKNAQEWALRLTLAIVGTAVVAVLGIYLYHLRRK